MSTLIENFFRFFFGPPALIAASACFSFAADFNDSFKTHKIKKDILTVIVNKIKLQY